MTLTIVEHIMSQACAGPVRLEAMGDLGGRDRSAVERFRVRDAPSQAPTSVIVKRSVAGEGEAYDPDATGAGPAWRLFNDWAGLQLLGDIFGDASPAPRLYGGNRAHGLIVMEDIGAASRLDALLLGHAPAPAEGALLDLAATLGRMHAATIGQGEQYRHIRGQLGPRTESRFADLFEERNYGRLATMFHDAAAALDVVPRAGSDQELHALIARLSVPGPFHAYTHRDACPDNVLQTSSGTRLLDFEFGGYGHALIDGVYGCMHFPSCWCVNRLPRDLPLRMEERYRAALSLGCPEATDDALFYHAVVDACAVHVISRHDIPALLGADEDWGIATRRQRTLMRFYLFARLTEQYGHLRALGATIGDMLEILDHLWSPGVAPMPLYPAFR